MKKNIPYPILVLGVLLCLWSCTPNQINRGEVTPSTQLYTGLEKAEAVAASKANFRSLLVSIDNKLILEKYYKPYSRDSLDHLRSATKSIMTTLIGIAIDQGLIPNMDVSISGYIPVPSPEKAEITIKHLASMTSGLE